MGIFLDYVKSLKTLKCDSFSVLGDSQILLTSLVKKLFVYDGK